MDKILVEVEGKEAEDENNIYNTEVRVGHYSDYEIYPTCGLATDTALVGKLMIQDILLIRTELKQEFSGLQRVILNILYPTFAQCNKDRTNYPFSRN